MLRYTYVAKRDSGEPVSGVVRAISRREALAKLLEQGVHPVAVDADDGAEQDVRARVASVLGRVRMADLAVFTRQLAALLKAGLPMIQALATLRKQTERRGLRRVIEDLEHGLTGEAMSLAEAMAQHPRVFDPVYRGLVHSGEEGGKLTEVLEQLAAHLARAARLRGQIVGAFIYPFFLLLMGVSAVFVLMAFVIPKFEQLFQSFGQDLPWPTRLMIGISGFTAQWWWAILLGVGVLVGLLVAAIQKESVRAAVDRAVLGLPLFGPMFRKIEVARIARTLGALLDGGVQIVKALEIAAQTVRNRAVGATFGPIVRSVSEGNPLGEAMEATGLYPPLATNLVRTGEDTGELTQMLGELAEIYDDEAERSVNGAVKLLEPGLIVVMGLVIAGIVAAVMLPVFQSSVVS